ncbi:unnamed protein product [Calypogeia fissa]
MCQTTTTMMGGTAGNGEPHVDRHALRNTQRKLKMEAVLGSTVLGSVGPDRLRTPSPQRKSILSRNQSYSGKENNPGTPPTHPVTTTTTTPISRLGSGSGSATAGASTSSLSPTKTTPLLGVDERRENLRYTSLSELVITIPNSPFSRSESFGTSSPVPQPRTPMKDALVEKAVRAYLQPSESFSKRRTNSGWGMCLVIHQFLPSFMTKFSFAIPNPIQFFCCAIHAFSMYMTRQSAVPLPLYLSTSINSQNQPEYRAISQSRSRSFG